MRDRLNKLTFIHFDGTKAMNTAGMRIDSSSRYIGVITRAIGYACNPDAPLSERNYYANEAGTFARIAAHDAIEAMRIHGEW